MNNIEKAFRAAVVALPLIVAGCESCRDELIGSPGPGQGDCDEVSHTARPVDGACLENEFASLGAYREECKGTVVKVMQPCFCGETDVPVWACSTTPGPTGSAM